MSDTPEYTADDVSDMTETQLREHYDRLTQAITTLEADPLTIETGKAIRALRIERNAVASAVSDLMALAAESAEMVDASDVVLEALAAADIADDTADEVDEVAAVTTTPTPTSTGTAPAAVDAPIEEATDVSASQPDDTPAGDPGDDAETTISDDVTTPIDMEETTVADTPDPTVPSAAETESLIAEAQSIVDGSALAVTAGLHDARPSGTATLDRPTVGFIAMGGQTEFSQGTSLDLEALGQAIQSVKATGRVAPDGGTISGVVASLPSFEATQGMLHEVLTPRLSAYESTQLINETVAAWKDARKAKAEGRSVDAVTAAICTPLDIIRDVPECGVTDTPFSDLFPQRGVGRLGFQYFPGMALIDTNPNVNIWTETDQDGVDESDTSTWKPSPLIQCLPAVEVKAEELVASAQVDNSTQISQPEQVAQFMHKLAVQRARRREQYLQGLFDATASAYTHTGDYGALPALLSVGLELMPRLVYGERLDEGDYDLVLEPGHMAKLLADENSRVFGDTLASRKAGIISKIKDEMGVTNVVVLRDFRTGSGYAALRTPGQSAVALPRLYDSNRVRFVPAGAYIFGATGEEATGWETDPQLTRQNRMQWFSKEWLLLAKHGCHPAAVVDVVSCASGARADGIVPVNCTSQTS